MVRLSLIVIFCAVYTIGCKPRNNSQLKHDFGATSRVPENFKFGSCEISFESTKRFPKTQAFLQQIAMNIMENNPQVFKLDSVLDPKNFCINVKHDLTFNAFALSNNRQVVFHTAAVLTAENDAMLAAVMAHELAHITMLHGLSKHPKFKPTTKTMETIKQSQTLYRKLSSAMIQANRLRDTMLRDIDKISDEKSKINLQNELLLMFDQLFNKITDNYGNIRLVEYADQRNNYLKKIPDDIKENIAKNLDATAQIVIIPIVFRFSGIRLIRS